jgi:hypothetical protein
MKATIENELPKQDSPKATPNEILSKRIIAALIEKKLLQEDLGKKLEGKMSSGILDQSDWKLAFEISLGMAKHKQGEKC